jgi:hypothetical protein
MEDEEKQISHIPGGCFLVARKIFGSCVMDWPPEWFKLWIWLIGKANHIEIREGGVTYHRGEVLTSYREMQMVGGYKIGWRKIKIPKSNIRNFCEALRKLHMAVTKKSTRGFLINIDKYALYQDIDSYERHNERHKRGTREAQTSSTINKNDKNDKNDNIKEIDKEKISSPKKLSLAEGVELLFNLPEDLVKTLMGTFPVLSESRIRKSGEVAGDWLRAKGQPYQDYVAFFRNWLRREADRIVPDVPKKKFELENLSKYAIIQKKIDAQQEEYRRKDDDEPKEPKIEIVP